MNLRSLYWHFYLTLYVLIGTSYMIWIRLSVRDAGKQKHRLHQLEKQWARDMFRASGSTLTITGREYLDPHQMYVFTPNHQSAFDIFVLLGFVENPFVFLSKPLYFKIPIFGWAMTRMGHFSIDRKNRRQALIDFARAGQAIFNGEKSLALFPEGTRSQDGKILPFKGTALKVLAPLANSNNSSTSENTLTSPALARIAYVVPTVLIHTRKIQKKGSLKISPAHVQLRFLKPITVRQEALSGEARKNLIKNIEQAIRKAYAEHA